MPSSGQISVRPLKPLAVFDGDCGFCRFWVERWRTKVSDRVQFEPLQTASSWINEVPRERFEEALHLIESNGAVYSGGDAVLRILNYARGWTWLAQSLERDAICLEVIDWGYRFVANHRSLFSTL